MKRSPIVFWLFVAIAAYAAATITGLQTARQAAELRGLYRQLSDGQQIEDGQLREYRLLLLERATLAGYQNVEPIARDELNMRFPDDIVQVRR